MGAIDTHPSAQELAAFTLGTLADDAHLSIEAHVAVCSFCQERAAVAPDDGLVELLRTAHARAGCQADTSVEAANLARTPTSPATADLSLTHAQTDDRHCDGDLETTDFDDVVPAELASHGRYRIRRRLGRGGMGAVYEAEHRVMQRSVALKVINRSLVVNANAVERFRREVRAAARLSHPNIVSTYDAEDAGHTHFLVMEFVEGVSLGRWVKERGPLPVVDACAAVRQAALGLQHAHERGMVHRDVKPGNLIRCADGTVKVLDFGLATLTAERDDELNADNIGMGTPDFMAPQQGEDPRSADIRADVYSLGCTLYYLLTGQPPYPACTSVQTMHAHRERPIPNVRRDCPEVPPALAAVLTRMLAKRPEDRYQTPMEVDLALAPFTQPQRAAPGFAVRRRLIVVLATLVTLGLALAGVVTYRIQTDTGELVITSESDDVDVVIKQGGKTIRVVDIKTDKQVTLSLRSGVYELAINGPDGLKLNIDKATLTRGNLVLAKIESVSRAARADAPDAKIIQPVHQIRWPEGGRFSSIDITQDGRMFLAARTDLFDGDTNTGKVRVWDMETGTLACEVNGYVGRFTPDGRHLIASSSEPSDFHVYELPAGTLVRRFGSPDPCWNFVLSPDGSRVVNRTPTDHEFYDWSSGKQLCRIPANDRAVLTRDGRFLLTQDAGQRTVRAVDTETGKETDAFRQLRDVPPLRAMSADGTRLLCVGDDADRVFDTATGKQVAALGPGICAALSGNGRLLVQSTNRRDDYGVWDVDSGRLLARLQFSEPFATIREVHISRDGRYAIFAGPGDCVHVFRLPEAPVAKQDSLALVRRMRWEVRAIWDLSLSPDGGLLLAGGGDDEARVWEVSSGTLRHTLRGGQVGFLSGGKQIVTQCGAGPSRFRMYETESGRELRAFGANSPQGVSKSLSPDGRSVVGITYDGTVRIWDVETGQVVLSRFKPGNPVTFTPLFSPDGRYALVRFVNAEPTWEAWDIAAGRETDAFEKVAARPGLMAILPGAREVLERADDGFMVLDVATGKEVRRIRWESQWDTEHAILKFSPDYRRLLTVHKDETVRIHALDGDVLRERGRIDFWGVGTWYTNCWSADGRYAAVASRDGRLMVLRVPEAPPVPTR
jgi:WD40 repeat protein